jgi:predicted MFS family arabinose efflux permease
MMCAAIALAAAACTSTFTILLGSLAVVGFSTVTGQLLTPLAGDLALPEQRGQVIGFIVSGVLTGILLSRTISGVVGDFFGWRAIYLLAAAMSATISIWLRTSLPADKRKSAISYHALLLSVIAVVRQHQIVKVMLVLGALVFGVFSMFWTALTFLLSAPPFFLSPSSIGLVGLVGLAGALAAQRSGLLHDKGWSGTATGAALTLALVSQAIA